MPTQPKEKDTKPASESLVAVIMLTGMEGPMVSMPAGSRQMLTAAKAQLFIERGLARPSLDN